MAQVAIVNILLLEANNTAVSYIQGVFIFSIHNNTPLLCLDSFSITSGLPFPIGEARSYFYDQGFPLNGAGAL